MFYNGKDWKQYMETTDTHLLDGYSIYEVVRTYDGRIFAFDKHYERLQSSGKFLSLQICGKEKMLDVLNDGINKYKEGNIKIKIYSTLQSSLNNSFYAFITKVDSNTEIIPRLIIAEETKSQYYIVPYNIKTHIQGFGFYLRDKYKSYYDALVCDDNGYITECTKASFCCIKSNTLYFPKLTPMVLSGVTRDIVVDLALAKGLCVKYQNIHVNELSDYDEFMVTHTSSGVVAIESISKKSEVIYPKENKLCYQISSDWNNYIKSTNKYWSL